MVTISEWYARANAQWGEDPIPVPSPEEALAGAKKLFRFETGRSIPAALTSGNRYTWVRWQDKAWTLRVNPNRKELHGGGWKALVHDLSHYLHRHGGSGDKPHSASHARLEARLIKEVKKRGWLSGALQKENAPGDAEASSSGGATGEACTPTVVPDPRAVKLEKVLQAIKRWQSKERRAKNALAKLNRKAKYYSR